MRRIRNGTISPAVPPIGRRLLSHCCLVVLLLLAAGCQSWRLPELDPAPDAPLLPSLEPAEDLAKPFRPSNHRQWEHDQAVLPRAVFHGDRVTVQNIRNCNYFTTDDYIVHHYDRTFDLRDLESVDFIMVPFAETPALGHTMMSFGFAGGDYLCVSVEIRKEKGERYGPLRGFFNQYELMYVLGDERDLIGLRANHRLDDVYVHRTRATPEQARELFADVMQRVNKLAEEPEFYNTLTNNCTTNIRNHINRLSPDRVPYDYRVLLPGYSDELAYDLGLLATDGPFSAARRRARVTRQAFMHRGDPDFSVAIRR